MERLIEVTDFKIFTKIEGQGHPIVLLHSLWGNHLLFDNLVHFLAPKYQTVCIDFPGHGNSSAPSGNFSFEDFALVIEDVLKQLGIRGEISLLGHSMGGFAALAFARQFQDRVASLILVHSLAKGPDSVSIHHRLRQAELIRCGRRKLLLRFANDSNFAPGNAAKFPQYYTLVKAAANLVSPEGALAAIHAINTRQNNLPFLMKTPIPKLMVIGKHDRIYNPEDQLWEFNNLTGAQLLLLQHSGHLGFFEQENHFKKSLDSFLCSVPSLKLTV